MLSRILFWNSRSPTQITGSLESKNSIPGLKPCMVEPMLPWSTTTPMSKDWSSNLRRRKQTFQKENCTSISCRTTSPIPRTPTLKGTSRSHSIISEHSWESNQMKQLSGSTTWCKSVLGLPWRLTRKGQVRSPTTSTCAYGFCLQSATGKRLFSNP